MVQEQAAVDAPADAHIQNARSYAHPRVHDANRPSDRLAHDPLIQAMIPPTCPEQLFASTLIQNALSGQLSALEAGQQRPGERHGVKPGAGVPMAVSGVLADKYVDDELLWVVHSMRKHMARTAGACERIQIVDLGCGLGTRPWRLPLSHNVAWFDLDLPSVIEEKLSSLQEAGAQLHPPAVHADLRIEGTASAENGEAGRKAGPGAGAAAGAGNATGEGRQAAFPLLVGSYTPVVCHMLKGSIQEALTEHGWDPEKPTIWVAFALVYYLDGRAVDLVMRSVAAASAGAPASAFVGTIMNAGMVEMIQEMVAKAGAGARAESAAAGEAPPPSDTLAEASATVDPAMGGSMDASDEMRRTGGVQASATAMKFGVHKGVTAFLEKYGWQSVEETSLQDWEAMYQVYAVTMQYPEELRERMQHKYGEEPRCSVGVGRRGF